MRTAGQSPEGDFLSLELELDPEPELELEPESELFAGSFFSLFSPESPFSLDPLPSPSLAAPFLDPRP